MNELDDIDYYFISSKYDIYGISQKETKTGDS